MSSILIYLFLIKYVHLNFKYLLIHRFVKHLQLPLLVQHETPLLLQMTKDLAKHLKLCNVEQNLFSTFNCRQPEVFVVAPMVLCA